MHCHRPCKAELCASWLQISFIVVSPGVKISVCFCMLWGQKSCSAAVSFFFLILCYFCFKPSCTLNKEIVLKNKSFWFDNRGKNSWVKYSPCLRLEFKLLGIWLITKLEICYALNFREKYGEIKNLVKSLLKRVITPMGRVAVLKSLILTKLIYLCILLLLNPF